MSGIRITPFGTVPKISNLVVDKDLDMGAYGIMFRGSADGAIGVLGVDEIASSMTVSETAIYSKSYTAMDKKTEVAVSCVIPKFLSGSLNLYYTGNSEDNNRNKGYKFYKNEVLLQEDFDTAVGTVTGSLDVDVVEEDTLKIIGYGSGGSYIGGTNFTISYRGVITGGKLSPTFTQPPGAYPTTIPFTVED